ncbi:MAG: RecX family transcriptional regulator [Bacilli bacterium]
MEIIKYRRKKNLSNQYEILLSDNTTLSFYDDTIIKYNLLSNKVMDDKMFKEVSLYNMKIDYYYKTIKFINKRLRTKKEIEDFLKKLNCSEEVIEFIVVRVEKEGYLNDSLYIKSYINDQINLTLKGEKKIINELINLEFNKDEVENNISLLNIDFKKRIERIITKKLNGNHQLSARFLKEKIKKDLYVLGYNLDEVNDVIETYTIKDSESVLRKQVNKEYRKLSRKYKDEELNKKIKYNLYKLGFIVDDINKYL